jgi:hypothetical protein
MGADLSCGEQHRIIELESRKNAAETGPFVIEKAYDSVDFAAIINQADAVNLLAMVPQTPQSHPVERGQRPWCQPITASFKTRKWLFVNKDNLVSEACEVIRSARTCRSCSDDYDITAHGTRLQPAPI